MKLRHPYFPSAAFTLLEVVISVALLSLILASAYMCFDAGIRGRKIVEPRVEVLQNARVAMALMAADLRSACPLSKDVEFLGTQRTVGQLPADRLDFATHNYTPRREREGDFCEESFFLDKDPTSGRLNLYRRRNPTMAQDPLEGGNREELATGLVGARFEYTDGLDWYDTWGEIKGAKQETSQRDQPNLSGMPEAVRITLFFDADPSVKITPGEEQITNGPPLVFQTVAYLMLTDASSSSGASSSSSSDQSNSGMPNGGVSQ